ncbi:MAG: tsaE [Bacteroidetes bacterium]|nr:tsaE [Bacteroidota bacterium]
MQHTIIINNISDLSAAAAEFLKICSGKKIFAFSGQMGAGKTTFIKTVCEALGVKDPISSPTFSIVNEYVAATGEKIYHFDFYRIKSESEAYDMGYEEYLYSKAWCFIEWPEKIDGLLPDNTVQVSISLQDDKRTLFINL